MRNILRVVVLVFILLGCVSVQAQEPGCPAVTTTTHVTIPCGQTCTNLTASAVGGGATTSYSVASIAYLPPFAFNAGVSILSDSDDQWSQTVIPLGFNFCFFNQIYTQAIVGSNGCIGFNTFNAGTANNFAERTVPFANGEQDMRNTIMTPWQDLDDTYQGQVFYNVGGTAPCRYLAVSFYKCPMYGDPNSSNAGFCTTAFQQTQMAVIYETSNVIDIYIAQKGVPCEFDVLGFNGHGRVDDGLATEGIMNNTGTVAYTVPGRNASIWPTNRTLTNDAWRFTPAGAPNFTITWFQGTTQIGTGSPINVCPTVATNYNVVALYTNCDGSTVSDTATVFVGLGNLTVKDSAVQPTCNGSGTGSVFADFNSTSGIISYGWAPGGAGDTVLTNIGPGTYIFTVKDSANCVKADTVVLSTAGALTVSVANDTATSCTGTTNNGALSAVVSSGAAPYTYLWSPGGATTNSITGLNVGTYTVTATDKNGCTGTASASVSVITSPLTFASPQVTEVRCYGTNTGQIIDPVNGGTNPITYNWSLGGTAHGDTLSGLAAGTYTVTAIDANSCSATASFTITQATSALTASVANDTVSTCSGATNIGTLNAAVSGGIPAYTYIWSNTATTDTVTGLTTGNYTVTVGDASGCTVTSSASVLVKSSNLNITGQVYNPSCAGAKGTIIINVTGGAQPLTYTWTGGGSITDTLTNIAGGTYHVTVTDGNGCSATAAYTVNNLTPVLVTLANDTVYSCNGTTANGTLTAIASGGSPGYTYLWSNTSTGNPITGLSAGSYTVTVTDAVGCSTVAAASVVAVANPVTFNTPQVTNAACAGSNTGQIILSTTGGTAPVTFTWSGGTTQNDTLRNVAGGTYTITATDANGCSATASATVTQSPAIVFGTPVITNVGCSGGSGGSISVTATGGTGSITYVWSNGATTNTITGLNAGGYKVTATDGGGCTATAIYTVSQSAPIAIGPATIVGVSCTGANGSIFDTASGGTAPLTFTWSGALTGANINNLAAGGYHLTVTDANGCSATAYYIVGHDSCGACPQVNQLNLNNNVSIGCAQTCTNLIADVFSAKQTTAYAVSQITYTPPFAFNTGTKVLDSLDDLWSQVITLPFNFCFFGIPYNQVIIGSNGELSFNPGDSLGVDNFAINPAYGGPGPVPFANRNAERDQRNTIMAPWQDLDPTHHGSIFYNISGTAPCRKFEVSWYDCPMFGDSSSRDPFFCDSTDHQTSMVVLYETTNAIDIYIENKDVVCNQDTANTTGAYWNGGDAIEGIVNASMTTAYTVPGRNAVQWTAHNDAWRFSPAGANNYTLAWYANGTLLGTNDTLNVCPTVPTTYSVFATYTNCDNSQVIVGDSVYVTPGGNLTVNIDSTRQILCNNDSSGAVYASFKDTSSTVTSFGWSPGGANLTSLINIPAGTYIFTVTTANGCTKSDTVVLANPTAVTGIVANDTFTSCTINNLGTLTVAGSGGAPGYTYLWSNGLTTTTITGLTPGTYTVTVTDSHGCTGTGTATVVQVPGNLAFTTTQTTNPGCIFGGSITVGVSGGIVPLTYTWSPTEPNSGSLLNLGAGTYALTVTDAGGCSITASFTLTPAPTVSIDSATVVNVSCNGSGNGSVTLHVSGGTPPLSYTWTGGTFGDTSAIAGLTAGTYAVTVTDTLGCTATASYNILQPTPIAQDSATVIGYNCPAGGSVFVYDTGGVAPLTYLWSGGQTADSITNQLAGTYTLTVTDAAGCSITASYTIGLAPGALAFGPPVIVNENCNGDSAGSITAIATGGHGTITYLWSNTATTTTITGLIAGTYTITATDSLGCSVTASYSVTQPTAITFGNVVIDSIKCSGGTGGITVVATGGTGTITYAWASSAGASVTGLTAGTYCVTATDGSGCSVSTCYTLTQPTPLVIDSGIVAGATCTKNGYVVIAVSGGTPGYSYGWSGGSSVTDSLGGLTGGNVTVTVTDAKGCTATATYNVAPAVNTVVINSGVVVNEKCNGASSGSVVVTASGGVGTLTYHWGTNPSTTDSIVDVSAGNYAITVTDSLGCTATATYTVTQPTAIVIADVDSSQVTCTSQGSLWVIASGGTGAYTYTWQGSAVTTDTLSNLSAGTYNVTVTDANSCSVSAVGTVTTAPNSISLSDSTITEPSCNGNSNGSITVRPTGGSGGYTYLWSNGNTTNTITGLTAGTYCLTVHDSNGCSKTACDSVGQPTVLVITSFVTVNATCNAPGSAQVVAGGGTPVYTYVWSPGGSTANPITGLLGGAIVFVTVTDHNGCTVAGSDTLAAAPLPLTIADSTIVNDLCNNGTTGSIALVVTGGVVGETTNYLWSPGGATTSSITSLAAGTYHVTISDIGGCILSDSFKITQPAPYVVAVSAEPLVCPGTCDVASVTVTPVNAFTYVWSNGATTQSSSYCNLTTATTVAGVTVTDNNHCTAKGDTSIAAAAQIVSNPQVTPTPCSGTGAANVVTTGTGGAPGALTYTYNPGNVSNTTGIFNGLAAGNYTYTVSDALGCSVDSSFTVLPVPPGDVDTVINDSTTCYGLSNGSITVIEDSVQNGPFTYAINGGAAGSSNTFDSLGAGNYLITVTNHYGCVDTIAATIGQPAQQTVTFSPDTVYGFANTAIVLTPVLGNFTNPVFNWTPTTGLACPTCATDSATLTAPQLYYVTVNDSGNAGCTVTDSVWVLLYGPIMMPNAFSPNSDGKNDFFGPLSIEHVIIKEFHIYNRWGQLVYSGTGYWDGKFNGKEQPDGTYIYYIEGTYIDPNTELETTGKVQGAVTLLR